MTVPAVDSDPSGSSGTFIAMIGDLVDSKRLDREERTDASNVLSGLLAKWNQDERTAAAFVISRGDEFEGLLRAPSMVSTVLWDVAFALPELEVRIGIGAGEIYTPLVASSSDEVDGPVYHAARAAIEAAAGTGHVGGDFRGFAPIWDSTLGALARALYAHRRGWTDAQRRVAGLLRDGWEQVRIAEKFGVTRQNISKHAAAASWSIHADLERALDDLVGHAWRAAGGAMPESVVPE